MDGRILFCQSVIYIPICFYYFCFFRNRSQFFSQIYIPICFYYFHISEAESPICANLFTFQYVSIISILPYKSGSSSSLFTFQYVSIISKVYCHIDYDDDNLHSNMFLLFLRGSRSRIDSIRRIYIPICFYYFLPGWIQFFQVLYHLHSNMFLLFLYKLSAVSFISVFTFQYVSIISVICNFSSI